MNNDIRVNKHMSKYWNGQTNFKRQADTSTLERIDSPYKWHERLVGTILRTLSSFR